MRSGAGSGGRAVAAGCRGWRRLWGVCGPVVAPAGLLALWAPLLGDHFKGSRDFVHGRRHGMSYWKLASLGAGARAAL